MKSRLPHVVTLSPAALAVLQKASAYGRSGLVFPSARAGRPLSDMTLAKVLRAAGRSETVHGFRSSFRDWAAKEMPTMPAMVAEKALAHSVGTATEKAYLRSDLRDLRFELVDAWGDFVASGLKGVAHE
jgi:integrase